MYLVEKGSIRDIKFQDGGLLSKFLRLPSGMDLADDHKWCYPLAVQAYQQRQLQEGSLMVMLDTHSREDLNSARLTPPPLPTAANQLGAHIDYTRSVLGCMDHLAPIAYTGLVDEMIIVYPTGEPPQTIDMQGKWREGFKWVIYESMHYSGKSPKIVWHESQATPKGEKVQMPVSLTDSEFMIIEDKRPVKVTFTPLEHLPMILGESLERSDRSWYYNLDLDYWFSDGPEKVISRDAFARIHEEVKRIKEPSYKVACTSTDHPSHTGGAKAEQMIEVITDLEEILAA